MEDWLKDEIAKNSIRLPDGGDTHIHPWKGQNAATVTTRMKGTGGLAIHQDFQDYGYGLIVSESKIDRPHRSSSPASMEQPVWRPPPVNPML